jgi:hypothetical protein
MNWGVSGVYKVMKAERLSRNKSLTVGVAPSLTDFKSEGRRDYTSVRWALLVIGTTLFEDRNTGALLF